uniref:Lipocalin/cytosolic fatty-acid binding domain-containing protein n=1 Tax=Branchiostoma floridae TaxID=7739 RepID=C3ZN87_BRAFL|eukprot:XP_002590039.1 hypothetical protein BRAFLDRAFT_122944 [Branchiostoma floridae]
MREIVQSTIPRETIMQDGDTFNIKTIAQKITEVKFKVGEEFEGEIHQGKVKISPTLDSGKLRFEFDSPKGKQVQEREVRADGRLYLIHGLPTGDKVKTLKLGEEVEDQGRLGKMKVKAVKDGNKVCSTETYANGKTSSTVREVNGDEMTVTMTTGDFTVSHVYKRE